MYYDKHIFVCENVREEGKRISCGRINMKEIRELLKRRMKEVFPEKKIRVNMSGCLDRCEEGPVQVIYPEGKWYCIRSEEDVELFLKSLSEGISAESLKLPS
ncbi:MAG TPA: (2Fe-2S) ferredoxin domain-containing protein [Leptospiraceae bacterium]|nr:(2Fe-2S) ferredoxin domain-containing protein [Leptospiraceae bacterium]HNO26782.1 (2Fe-2S) ferredoxin domain-containing protein [Leptospiraceae bacterium]